MEKTMNELAAIYQKALRQGDVPQAYMRLLKYLMALKGYFETHLPGDYRFGNVSPGYMDYSYFPFFSPFLRARKLRFGIVLNHRELRFELWLMGQNAQVQKEYWALLKDTEWNQGRDTMPLYSVLEAVLVASPDFDNLPALSGEILAAAKTAVEAVLLHIQ